MKTLTVVVSIISLLIYLGFGIYLIQQLRMIIRVNRIFHRKALIRITNLAFIVLPLVIIAFMAKQLIFGSVGLFALVLRLAAIRFYYYLIH